MWKRCSKSLVREMQIKTMMRYHFTSVRMAITHLKKVLLKMWRKGNYCWWRECKMVQLSFYGNGIKSMKDTQKIKNWTIWSSNLFWSIYLKEWKSGSQMFAFPCSLQHYSQYLKCRNGYFLKLRNPHFYVKSSILKGTKYKSMKLFAKQQKRSTFGINVWWTLF